MKKLLAMVLAIAMLLGCVSFASAEGFAESYDVTIWVAAELVDTTKAQIETFNATNELGIKINATIEPVSEADAATNMITDVEAGADIYCFAQDQFARLVQAGALSKLDDYSADIVKANNAAGVVSAALSGEALYAYPLTADNGYFMYYDKSVIPEEDIDSLEALIADCEAAQKYFSMEVQTSAWYLASFFFGTGCVSEWVTDDNGEFIEVNDTFDSAKGLIAVKGMEKLVKSPFHNSSSSGAAFDSGSAIVVTGTWDYNTVQGILGDNMGVADLPSFEVDGVSYHMGSFNGCKLMGVKPQVDIYRAIALDELALYLTGYDCQMERFEKHAWGPSNIEAQQSEAVQANPGLAALLAQSPYSVPQGQIHGSWWDIAKVIGTEVKDAQDEAGLQAALDNYQAKIASLFTLSDAVKYGWTVIGTVNGTCWDADLPMTNDGSGIWTSDEAYAMTAGTEFKVRQGLSWDNNVGNADGGNFVVEADGTYYVQFDANAMVITLIAQ